MYLERSDISNIISDDELLKLSNDDKVVQKISETVITKFINFANSMIDDSLRGKYDLPLHYVPETLKDIAGNIFLFKLYERRSQKVPDNVAERYNRAVDGLKQYTTGNFIQLPVDVQSKQVVYNVTRAPIPAFSKEKLSKY